MEEGYEIQVGVVGGMKTMFGVGGRVEIRGSIFKLLTLVRSE